MNTGCPGYPHKHVVDKRWELIHIASPRLTPRDPAGDPTEACDNSVVVPLTDCPTPGSYYVTSIPRLDKGNTSLQALRHVSPTRILSKLCAYAMIDQRKRLHVSPFSENLLAAALPPSIISLATAISFHTIQAFPEKNYGYVELPAMEAEKIKKKLNGSILKGKKIRVEEARPRKRHREETEEVAQGQSPADIAETRSRSSKKSKKSATIMSGRELSPGRKIKRGWTDPEKDKSRKSDKRSSSQLSSKYSEREELLFRTKVPPNKAQNQKKDRKGGKTRAQGTLIHEFERSTIQPSFLREDQKGYSKGRAAEYVDGKGWVDEKGQVVEEEKRIVGSRKQRHGASQSIHVSVESKRSSSVEAESRSPENNSLNEVESSLSEPSDTRPTKLQNPQSSVFREAEAEAVEDGDETSSDGTSSDSSSDSGQHSDAADPPSTTSLEDSHPTGTSDSSVHPLEALFKRPQRAASQDVPKPSLEVQTSFSFFEADEDTSATIVPETPFNSQDQRSRVLRSAAPTPDTAAPSRFNSWGSGRKDAESEDEDEDEDAAAVGQSGDKTPSRPAREQPREESDFAKWFWENRGDNNRAWKRRRREVMKEKRQRENRQRGHRV